MAKMTVQLEAPGLDQRLDISEGRGGEHWGLILRVDKRGTPVARFHIRITDGTAELLHAYTNGNGEISA